jgi:hypothetical protein
MEAGLQNGRPEESVAPAAPGAEAVDAFLAKFPGPVRLYANKRFVQVLFWIFAAMEYVLGKALLLGTDKQHFTVQIIFFIVLLWPVVLTSFITVSRNALALDLDRDGFTINAYAWYRARRYLWTDVGDFGTRPFHFMTLARYQDQAAGRQRLIPDTYGLGAEGLAQLMTQWRQRALGKSA